MHGTTTISRNATSYRGFKILMYQHSFIAYFPNTSKAFAEGFKHSDVTKEIDSLIRWMVS